MTPEVKTAFDELQRFIDSATGLHMYPNTNDRMRKYLSTIAKELHENAAVLSDLVQEHNANWEVTSVKAIDENTYTVALTVRDRATALWFESQHRRGGDLKDKNLNNE